MSTVPHQNHALPPDIRELAARLGVTGSAPLSLVTLTQRGTMRDRPGGRKMRFHAVQRIDLQRPGFEWKATTGPFRCISVVDALKDGQAELEVRVFRWLRIAAVRGGEAPAKGEGMRYLAELAWAPDAILYNPSLSWAVINHRTFRVSAGRDHARGEVELRLDGNGRVGCVMAQDRPRKEGNIFVERPWHGRFLDYRKHQERWLPFRAEVGWVLDGQTYIAWRGELLSWRAL